MNTKLKSIVPLAVSINPFTNYKSEFYTFDEFEQSCIDLLNFKIKPETYIHPEHHDYDCEGCFVIPHVNPKRVLEVIGYEIQGYIRKFDTDHTPHKQIHSKKVRWIVGKNGVMAFNSNKPNISYVLGTDNFELFIKIAKTGETILFCNNIDQVYQFMNDGISETVFRVMVGLNEPMQNKDLFIKVSASFSYLSPKEIRQFFLKEIMKLKDKISSEILTKMISTTWGELIPLVQAESLTKAPYPIDTFPIQLKEVVIAISEYVQVPIAMTAQCVIGAISHIAQARVNAPNQFNPQGEPCSLYLLTEGQSGSRKSTCRNITDKIIIQREHKRYELYRYEFQQWQSKCIGLNKKVRDTNYIENPPPLDPSTLFSDITLESISGLYIDGVINNASIATDEAGQFFGGYTMKGEMRTQAIAGYAKLFDDGFVERTRSKSNLNGSGRAYDVRLTFNLQGQHEILANALKDPVLRGQGFLPRFILTVPENLAGTRLQDDAYRAKNINTDPRVIAYWNRFEYLLDEHSKQLLDQENHNRRYVIPMNDEAKSINDSFYDLIESLQGVGKRFEYLQEFASRASQLARRLATVFAFYEGLPYIDAKILECACEVVKHSLNEWARYADIEVKKESDAQRLIKWLIRKCVQQQSDRHIYSYVQTSCPRPIQGNKTLLELTIQQLIDSNHIRIELLGRTRYVVLNPILLK